MRCDAMRVQLLESLDAAILAQRVAMQDVTIRDLRDRVQDLEQVATANNLLYYSLASY